VTIVVVAVLLAAFCAAPSVHAFGDRLLRTYFLFENQPLTASAAQAAYWTNVNAAGCDPRFGYQYSNPSGISKSNPTFLFYTAAGQLAGFGIRVWGTLPAPLLKAGLWIPALDGEADAYDIYLQTRSPSTLCSGAPDSNAVGNTLNINGNFPIPLNMSVAEEAGWVSGNCIYQMGIHHAYDIAQPFNQTWDASTLVPVMPMYEPTTGNINAILINIWNYQRTEPIGVCEGPFTSGLFCKNWCANTNCHFDGVSIWTTLHWHFVDPSTISCSAAPCQL